MCAVRPDRAMYLATMTSLFSVAGGVAGYAIGYFAFDLISPWVYDSGFQEHYEQARNWFDEWGAVVVFIAGFSPIPYKVFTISAGALEQNLIIFIFASLVGRGARFFLVALLLKWAGPKVLPFIERRINVYGWVTLGAIVVAILWYYLI